VFVLDISSSTLDPFGGSPVGDFNSDGRSNTILDAELAALKAMNQALIGRGLGDEARIAIVAFSSTASALDMTPATPGRQISTFAAADLDGNGSDDVTDVLRVIRGETGTNFRDALQQAVAVFTALGTLPGKGSLIFLSDGFPTAGGDFGDGVSALRALGVNSKAFGVGLNASLAELVRIDPRARVVTNTDQLLGVFNDLSASGVFAEQPMPGVVVFLDDDNNNRLGVTERFRVTGADGAYCFTNLASGCYFVRQIVPEGYYENVPGAVGDHLVCVQANQLVSDWNLGDKGLNRFGIPRRQGDFMEFTHGADIGVAWRIERSLDLMRWTTLTNIVGTNYGVTIRDLRIPPVIKAFYRGVRE
jgi:hypothetical protein